MKEKLLSICSLFVFCIAMTSCAENGSVSSDTAESTGVIVQENAPDNNKQSDETTAVIPQTENDTETENDNTNIFVAYFSLAGEQYDVGVIEKGNTEIIAEMIADATNADLFKIESTEAYPTTYDGLLDVSKKEQTEPPEIAGTVDNMENYDTIFLGYPIWWGDTPTIVNVFLQSYDFSGKTIVPFCTHGGSGLSGTDGTISELCPDSTIGEGFAILGSTAQNGRDGAKNSVTEWLSDNGYI